MSHTCGYIPQAQQASEILPCAQHNEKKINSLVTADHLMLFLLIK